MRNYWIMVILIMIIIGIYFSLYLRTEKIEKKWNPLKDSLYWQIVIAAIEILLILLPYYSVPLMWVLIGIILIAGTWSYIRSKISETPMDIKVLIQENYNYKDYFWVVILVLTVVSIIWSTAVYLD